MSRRTVVQAGPVGGAKEPDYSEELEELILSYKDDKATEKSVKERVDAASINIKSIMKEHGLTEFVVGTIKASVTEKENQSFNELQAIEILRAALTPEQFSTVVKAREYIDDDAFEGLVYNKEVSAEILQPAISPAPSTITLRIGKVK